MRLSKYLSLEDEKERSLVARRFVASAAIGILISALLSFCSGWNIFGGSGLVDRIGSLTANLTGFYVAALVAVTTFGQGRPEMESEMPSGKVYLLDRGERVSINRREYVTALFGHLVILAFFVTIVSIAGTLGAAAVGPVFDEVELIGGISSQRLIVFLFLAPYLFLVAHLISETARGLDYLVDKIYRKHPSLVPGSLVDSSAVLDKSSDESEPK